MAALCVAAANWTRYSAVVLVPLIALSVLWAPGLPLRLRLVNAAGATTASLLLIAPLWLRNHGLSGHISGSNRGGLPSHVMQRFTGDIGDMLAMFDHALFDFDFLLRAHVGPLIVLAVLVLVVRRVRRGRFEWPRPSAHQLPFIWAGASLAFLLFARSLQAQLDMDYRMLAVAAPFLFLAAASSVASLLAARSFAGARSLKNVLVAVMLGLMVNTGFAEATRVHENYRSGHAPGWRPKFGMVYRDLSDASTATRALRLALADMPVNTLVLTDYRALYVRYVSTARAYQVADADACAKWVRSFHSGVLLTGNSGQGITGRPEERWAQPCSEINANWQLMRIVGAGAHSMTVDQ